MFPFPYEWKKNSLPFPPLFFSGGKKMAEGKVIGWKVKTENIFSCLEDGLKINGKMNVFQVLKTFLENNYKISTGANPLHKYFPV